MHPSDAPSLSIADVRRSLKDALTDKYGLREATAMARIAVATLKGWSFNELVANEDRPASDFLINRIDEIKSQLLNDMPLQYALGQTVFYGLTLKVGPGVLIPRPETEQLVDLIVKENPGADLRVLDVCTGSGAIALALARNLPFSRVDAVDVSPRALDYARRNTSDLKAKINILQEDVFSFTPKDSSYDIIVSNPPYIDESEKAGMEANVLDYEPHEALFVSDSDPLVFYRRIAELGLTTLCAGGRLYFEINPRHAADLKALLENMGYADVEVLKDVHGSLRFAKARKE